MVDSREKGARGETTARDALRKLTKLKWERVPGSGAFDPKHGLKGDLYVPNVSNRFCVEVKSYKDCHIDHTLIAGKNPQLLIWWEQTSRQAIQTERLPLLIFKHDRSKLFAAFSEYPENDFPYIYISRKDTVPFYISLLEDYIINENPKFIL